MFNKIGTVELLVILVVALFVIGPEKLPGVAKSIGKMLGTARHYLKDITSGVEAEIKAVEKDLKEAETEIKDAQGVLTTSLKDPPKEPPKEEKAEVSEPEPAKGTAEVLSQETVV